MTSFKDLSNLTSSSGIGGLLSLPVKAYPYFWLWIYGGIWIIIFLALYFREKERMGRGNILSSMAVSCLAIMMLCVLGSIIGFITLEIMIITMVFCFLIIGIWFFSNEVNLCL
jgi:uncharacterized membrane protein